MESSQRLKVVYSRPEVKYEVVTEAVRTSSVRKVDISNEQDCKQVEILELAKEVVDSAKKSIVLAKAMSEENDCLVLDLYKWTEPNVDLKVGIEVPVFVKDFLGKVDDLLQKEDVDFSETKDKLPTGYNFLVLLLSFLRHLEFKNEAFIEALDGHIKKTYPPLLLLMNINGLLVHRTSEMIQFTMEQDKQKFNRLRVQVFRQGKNYVYTREGFMSFLEQIMSHPRVTFSFYSSIMRKNILPIITKMFEKNMPLLEEKLHQIFDQHYCDQAPEITGKPFSFIRNLTKIWESDFVANQLAAQKETVFNEANTLMLETEEIDVYNCFENSLIVDRYERNDVWPPTMAEYRDQIGVLKAIKQDLFTLFDECENVKDYIASPATPFSGFMRAAKRLEPLGGLNAQMQNLQI